MGLFSKKRSEELELPKFPDLPDEPSFPSYEPEFAGQEESPDEFGIPQRKQVSERPMFEPIERRSIEKPVFVKIEQYREALDNIEAIKTKVHEAEELLSRLDQLRSQEDKELQNWHENISRIKDKLLSVDKKLFEV